jgi:RNA polymerase sigma factor (sigma-70 family)
MGELQRDPEVEAFLTGRSSAVQAVTDAVAGAVGRFRLGADLHEELVQESLGRILLNLTRRRFRGEASLRTYASNVAKYTCLEHFRRPRSSAGSGPGRSDASGPTPEELYLRAEEHGRNLRAFAALSSECRELFTLIFVDRLAYREIAGRLAVSVGAIKSRVHRCRERVHDLLASRGDAPGKPSPDEQHYPRDQRGGERSSR